MYSKFFAVLISLSLSFSISTSADVTHWRVIKGAYYFQSADNTPDATTTNWGMFGIVETDLPGDAASVVITGGNIVGSIAYELEDSEWELGADYTSKAALDAVFPEGAYSIILSGGTLGTVTQQFTIAADAYPDTPYLTGADYSDCLALEALEPFELNWNDSGIPFGAVSLQLFTGAELDEGDTVFEIYSNSFSSIVLPWNLFVANSNYNGYIDFANAVLQSGAGGFGIDGDVSFNTSMAFHLDSVNTAAAYDDFNDNSIDTNAWSAVFSPEEAVDTFSEMAQGLGYTSAGTGDTFIAWSWDESELSYTQDWSIAVTINNQFSPGSFSGDEEVYTGLLVLGNGDFDNNISAEFVTSSSGREAATYVTSGGIENVVEEFDFVSVTSLAVKISFDADTKMLYTAYSTGGDYSAQANYSAANWGMTDSSTFNPVLFSGNFETEVTNGQVYADNFRIYEGKILSNEVEIIEFEFLHSYGDGTIFTEGNWIKAEADSTHRVTSMDVMTSGGDEFSIPIDGVENETLIWDVDVEFPFAELWDPSNDGDWLVTFGFNNGTFQSSVIPFMQEDGVTPLPNFYNKPIFMAPSPANGSVSSSNTFSFAWQPVVSNALFISLDEIINDNDIGDTELFFSDGLPGDSEIIADVTITGPLSTTNYGPIVLGQGFRRMRLNEGNGHAAYNDDGIAYIVVKQNEADIIFTVTPDGDGDNMDDAWEIAFFGGTNVANGGANDDFDMDGMLNVEEFIAGVNPTNGGSVFAVEEPGPSPAGFVINWNSVPGREYAVYWAKELADGFTSVTPGYLPHPQSSYTDTVHTVEGCGFYYIDVQREN